MKVYDLRPTQYGNRSSLYLESIRIAVIEHYQNNDGDCKLLEAEILTGLNEYDKLKAINESLLSALKDILLWGKNKDGKFTYTTSSEKILEYRKLTEQFLNL